MKLRNQSELAPKFKYHNPLSTSREKIIEGFRRFEDAVGNGLINLEHAFSLI